MYTWSVPLDLYESNVRAVTDALRELARSCACEPIRWWAAACAESTRDTAAIQLSTARWLLDL